MFRLKVEYTRSYSQFGEDLIVNRILNLMGIEKLSYLNIGAHNPVCLNNTYFFTKRLFGCK